MPIHSTVNTLFVLYLSNSLACRWDFGGKGRSSYANLGLMIYWLFWNMDEDKDVPRRGMTLITNEMCWEGKERNVETTVYNTKKVGIALRSERVGDGMRWGKKKKEYPDKKLRARRLLS
jgi:hypothetical protein